MTDTLFDEWQAYKKIVDNDYMGHAVFFEVAVSAIRRSFSAPIAILDLGCGDASPVQRVLDAAVVKRYCGVDESDSALAHARTNLASRSFPCELITNDLVDATCELSGPFDLIVASYSFHHIPGSEQKQRLLTECRRMLSDDGLLLVIDVFRREHEPREAYLQRWELNARTNFTALSEPEKDTLIDHIRSSDYPESLSTYQTIGKHAGYRQIDSLAEDGLNALVSLTP
jgi:cyclopropane fatty-acyl-phospholipid synthase-like methyltransferase